MHQKNKSVISIFPLIRLYPLFFQYLHVKGATNERKSDFRLNASSVANNSENILDEAGDKIKAGINAMTKKVRDPDKDLQVEYIREKFKEDTKDY